jgi:plasmid maintenance system antidote protein VapI
LLSRYVRYLTNNTIRAMTRPLTSDTDPLTERLLAAYQASGRDIVDVCKAAEVAPSYLRNLIEGNRELSLGVAIRFANALGFELVLQPRAPAG